MSVWTTTDVSHKFSIEGFATPFLIVKRKSDGHARKAWEPRSLNKSVDGWRALLDYGIERRELARNVAAAMRKVPRTRREMKTCTPDEIRLVLRAADKDRAGHLWYLALSGLPLIRVSWGRSGSAARRSLT